MDVLIEYKQFLFSDFQDTIKEIYKEESWLSYLNDDEKLHRAFENSLLVYGAFANGELVGFIRCVGDGEYIVLVQDLIVERSFQRRGIGTRLFKYAMERYKDVRRFQVITDIEDEVDNHFYQSFGMKKLSEGNMVAYFRLNI